MNSNIIKYVIVVIILSCVSAGVKQLREWTFKEKVKDVMSTQILYRGDDQQSMTNFSKDVIFAIEYDMPNEYKSEARSLFFFIAYVKTMVNNEDYASLDLIDRRLNALSVIRKVAKANNNKITPYEIFGIAASLRKESPSLWNDYKQFVDDGMSKQRMENLELQNQTVKNLLN